MLAYFSLVAVSYETFPDRVWIGPGDCSAKVWPDHIPDTPVSGAQASRARQHRGTQADKVEPRDLKTSAEFIQSSWRSRSIRPC